jgi:hypothetical protein
MNAERRKEKEGTMPLHTSHETVNKAMFALRNAVGVMGFWDIVDNTFDLTEKAAAEEIFKALDMVECPYCGKPTVCVDGETECAEITKLKKKFGIKEVS